MTKAAIKRASYRICQIRNINPHDRVLDARNNEIEQWELYSGEAQSILEAAYNNKWADHLYDYADSRAKLVKAMAQMAVGLGIAVLVLGKAYGEVFTFTMAKPWQWLDTIPTLKIVGSGLAYAAGLELAYMLFTSGPDEAIEPLILALAGAAMIEASRDATPATIASVAIFVIVIGLLFGIKRKYLRES